MCLSVCVCVPHFLSSPVVFVWSPWVKVPHQAERDVDAQLCKWAAGQSHSKNEMSKVDDEL